MTHPHWYLPEKWAHRVRRALGGEVDLDPCAARPELDTIKAGVSYLLPHLDGLTLPWSGQFVGVRRPRVYCNPPYDRVGVRAFADKAIAEAPQCAALAVLVPLAPTSRWWRDLARAAELCVLLSQRINFIDGSERSDDSTKPKPTTSRGDLCVFGWRLADPTAFHGVVVPRIMQGDHVLEKPQQTRMLAAAGAST